MQAAAAHQSPLGRGDELAHLSKQRDQQHCTHLYDTVDALGQNQQGAFQLQRDDDREDHTEQSLEHRGVGRIKRARQEAEHDLEQ